MNYPVTDTEMFIWEIKNRPALWDLSHSDYGKADKKKQCWEEIVDIFANEDADEHERKHFGFILQKRWKNLRGCFTRELMRQRVSKKGLTMARKSSYVYFNNLLFLNDSVSKIRKAKLETQNKNVDDSLSVGDKSPSQTMDNSENEDHDDIDNDPLKKESVSSCSEADVCSTANKNNFHHTLQSSLVHEEEDERLFLLSLVKPLKRVPEEHRLSVQIDIMNVIDNAIKKSK